MKLFSTENYVNNNIAHKLRGDENFEKVVKLGVALTESYIAKNYGESLKEQRNYALADVDTKDYELQNKAFETALFRHVFQNQELELDKDTRAYFRSPSPLKTAESERYYDVITAVLTTITPAVTNLFTGMYNEVRNIGYGDTAEFDVESNEILTVNKSAEGVAFGGEQHKHNYTKTINPEPLNISFSTNWYQVAAGKKDFGKDFFRAGQGFASYFTVEAYNKLYAMAQAVPASYKFTGFTTENIDLAVMAVEGANGGARASIIGTLPALREVVPTNDFFKVGIGEEWVKTGYVGEHAGAALVKIDNPINPATINSNTSSGTPSFMFYNNVLFVLPFVGHKPVKTVFEGDLFNITKTAIDTDDKTERASLTYRAGVDFVYDTIMAVISAS